jgi:hypothetical protein
MKKNIVLLDLIFYGALPLLFWNVLRDVTGDYYAMLLSSVPAILYTMYRFWEMKRVNVFGIYLKIARKLPLQACEGHSPTVRGR